MNNLLATEFHIRSYIDTIDCCIDRYETIHMHNHIPITVRRVIKDYLFHFLNDDTIRHAVKK